MDRVIAPEIVSRKRSKNLLIAGAAALALVAALLGFSRLLSTSIEATRIRTASAGVGSVENTLAATGEVVPAFEQNLISPIPASVRRVLLTPGTRVQAGQAIVELDKSLTLIEYERLKDQLALKRNYIEQLRMKLGKSLTDAQINDQIKSYKISGLRAELEDTRRLQRVGGTTLEDVTRAENALHIAELEKKQLENELTYNRQSMKASLLESTLQAQIEAKNLEEMEHKIKAADIRADRPGVLTWVNENIGSAVGEGEVLAKLADLGSFRVEGALSDAYADGVKEGQAVIVKVNDTTLRGLITRIKPTVKDGVVGFVVQLDNSSHASLKPSMKVDVFVVTKQAGRAVRVANGPAFKGRRKQFVFVLQDGVARRREIEIGLTNFDYVEVKSGLQPGEKVILTDLSEYQHLEELTIKGDIKQ
jgi:HlyD family secretion protein